MNKKETCIEEDEIDIIGLVKILLERKRFIIIFTSLTVLLAVVYVLIKTPLYEVKSNVQIGYIGKDLIVDPKTLVKTLKLVFNVEDKPKTEEKFISEVSDISANKKLPNFISIKTLAISNDEALKKNKEVVLYVQEKYKSKIKQYDVNVTDNIKNLNTQIQKIDNLDTENLKREIEHLKKQSVVKINDKIKFLKDIKIPALNEKIKFHKDKLIKYNKAVNEIYQNNKNNKDTTMLTISSLQMVNYQNLILNSQNRVEDLKVEIKKIDDEAIPSLEMQKENLLGDTLRQLEYKMKFELPNRKSKLQEKIAQLKFNISEHNVQNSRVVGKYVIKDYPVKPKKKLIVIVAFVTGFILSVFLVFFMNFIRNFKEYKEKD